MLVIKELLLMEDFTGTEDSNFGSTETFMRANLEMDIFMDKEDLFMSLEKIILLKIATEKKWEKAKVKDSTMSDGLRKVSLNMEVMFPDFSLKRSDKPNFRCGAKDKTF